MEAGAVAQASIANPGVKFVGVAAHDGAGAMQADIWRDYGVGSQPAFVFKKADGSTKKFGLLGAEKLQENIDRIFG